MRRIAIVGGGIAGVYTAWRLATASRAQKRHKFAVTLFECSSRFGGRIQSQFVPPLRFRAELGAMRFHSTHHLLRAIIDDLGIPARPFDVTEAHLRVRGRTLSPTEIVAGACGRCGAGIPFMLRPDERKKSPDALVKDAMMELLKNLSFPDTTHSEAHEYHLRLLEGRYSPDTWKFVRKHAMYENIPLRDIGFLNILQHYMSNEAFQLVHDAMSLESVLGNWNAAEAIPWFVSDFAAGDLWMVPGGMSRIVEKMISELESDALGNHSHLVKNAEVTACRQQDDETWKLWRNGNKDDGEEFDDVILALPVNALRRITITGIKKEFDRSWFDDIEPHRLYKIFLLYEHPWWVGQDLPGADTGRTYTDLPLRQVYYFHPDWLARCVEVATKEQGYTPRDPKWRDDFDELVTRWERPVLPSLERRIHPQWSLVMASYSDEHYVDFWDPPRSAGSSAPIHFSRPGRVSSGDAKKLEHAFEDLPNELMVTERIVRKVQQQLREIHGDAVETPVAGVYKNWSDPPIYAGWHTWKIGADPEKQALAPALKGLYFCGEAWSRDQGWIEGALKTAECVLRHLDIPGPDRAQRYCDLDFDTYIGL